MKRLLLLIAAVLGLPGQSAEDTNRWEKDIRAFEEQDRASPPKPGQVVFAGSSSIRLWDSITNDFPGVPLVRRGFGGCELGDVVRYCDRIIVPYRPRVAVIYAGENDLASGKMPEDVFTAATALVARIHGPLPNTRIVFLALKPSPKRWHLVDKIRQANERIRAAFARDPRLVFVDTFSPLLGPDGQPRKELYKDDTLHLNAAGYAVWAPLIAPPLAPPPRREESISDESKVPPYTLPDVLTCADGTKVDSRETWEKKRRPELVRLFEEHVYGRAPAAPATLLFRVRSTDTNALEGKATRKEVRIFLAGREDGPRLDLLLYVPNARKARAPAFLGLNFFGNHTIVDDPAVTLSDQWMMPNKEFGIVNNRATEASRGVRTNRWPVRRIVERGYALATAYYGDIDPDYDDGFTLGLQPCFYRPGQRWPDPDEWGSLAAWAWGLSRALDYLEKDPDVDAKKVAVLGHSRLGKASVWAGARDERFWIVISNDSGCGGAALSKRVFGETVGRINRSFPHWFCGNFKRYSEREADLPVDQHELIALVAPRPVYVASAVEDSWADPRGEFLSAQGAEPVYALYGLKGLPPEMPPIDQPAAAGAIGYHIRSGKHDLTVYDWERYLDFADAWNARGRAFQ